MRDIADKIDSIFPVHNHIPFDWDQYKQILDEERKKKGANKELINQMPASINLDMQEVSDGRFFMDISSAHIEGFLKKGEGQYLYVFLGGARTRNQGKDLAPIPTFSRWSWYEHTNNSILSLEDPMYYTFEKCKLGWFYGTETEDYREYCAQCIKKIANLLHISNEYIVLYGSSGGGTAAIGIANYLKGCFVVAINPQLNYKEYEYSKEFEESTGVRILDVEDAFDRNDNRKLIRMNNQNRFIIMVNVRSDHDFKVQLSWLCRDLDIIPEYGIKQHDNIITWIYNAYGAPSEHTSLENPTIFKTIELLIKSANDNIDLGNLSGLYRIFNEFWYDQYVLLKKNYDLKKKYNKKIKKLKTRLKNEEDKLYKLEQSKSYRLCQKISVPYRKLKSWRRK